MRRKKCAGQVQREERVMDVRHIALVVSFACAVCRSGGPRRLGARRARLRQRRERRRAAPSTSSGSIRSVASSLSSASTSPTTFRRTRSSAHRRLSRCIHGIMSTFWTSRWRAPRVAGRRPSQFRRTRSPLPTLEGDGPGVVAVQSQGEDDQFELVIATVRVIRKRRRHRPLHVDRFRSPCRRRDESAAATVLRAAPRNGGLPHATRCHAASSAPCTCDP